MWRRSNPEFTLLRFKLKQTSMQDTSTEKSIEKYKLLLSEIQNQNVLIWNYKGLKSIPESLIQKASHIQQIYLKHNLLLTLPDNLGYLRNLTFLYLYGNNIEKLPDSIGDIKNLTILDISNNRLSYLNPSITKLVHLKSLVIANNRLTCIPSEISKLKSLSLLILAGNKLCSLPESIGHLHALQGLYIDSNVLSTIPCTLANLPLLAHLSCCHNYLTNLPSKPFISHPALFFDNNPELNYIPFCLLQDLKIGENYDPFVVPSCGCFITNPITSRSVKVSVNKCSVDEGILHLPSQLQNISCYRGVNRLHVPPLLESCLRFLWKYKNISHFKHILDPGILPVSLANFLENGPIIFCEFCQTNSSFLYTSIIIMSIKLTSQQGTDGNEVPAVLYFCSDSCAHNFLGKVQFYADDYGLWLRKALADPIDVHIV